MTDGRVWDRPKRGPKEKNKPPDYELWLREEKTVRTSVMLLWVVRARTMSFVDRRRGRGTRRSGMMGYQL